MTHRFDDEGWARLLSRVGEAVDVEGSARDSGALRRKRGVRSGADLLRLALAYGPGGQSLRETAAWAEMQGVAWLSDVALLNRLRRSADWLSAVAEGLLAHRAGLPAAAQDTTVPGPGLRLRVVDGSVIGAPGRASGFRLQAVYDVAAQRFSQWDLNGTGTAESLERVAAAPGDVVMADRGYPRLEGLRHLIAVGAHYLIRVGRRSLALCHADGSPFDLAAVLDESDRSGQHDRAVLVLDKRHPDRAPLPARLVVLRKPPAAAERARQQALRESQRGGHRNDPLSLRAAGHLMLITSLPADRAAPAQLGAWYRLRWQIELAFKRQKSLLHIDRLPARDNALARAWMAAHLILAVLIDDLTPVLRDSPP